MNIGIVPNFRKAGASEITEKMTAWLKGRGVGVWLLPYQSAPLPLGISRREDALPAPVDYLIVLGGDGTLLSTARTYAPLGIPILGVNLGKLGFMTEIEVPELYWGLERLLAGQYRLDARMMLSARVNRQGTENGQFLALNEAVVTKGVLARMLRLSVYVNDTYVDTYLADGLILATPTGSTAYSLSAGGPIVYPNINVLVLTPICPHTLYTRSLILPEDGEVKIVAETEHTETMLTIDGQFGHALQAGDEIIFTKSALTTKLIRLNTRNFYDVLHQKLKGG